MTVALVVIVVAFLFLRYALRDGSYIRQTQRENNAEDLKVTSLAETSRMKLSSIAFDHNQNIPKKYTCDGENINPPLTVSDVPDAAKSLVLIVDDPDAPGKTWVHWVLYNIDPSVTEIGENSVAKSAIQGMTDFGTASYGGPCPPSGTHRYFFRLYALDTMLDLSERAGKKEVEDAMQGHILDSAELIGLYGRG